VDDILVFQNPPILARLSMATIICLFESSNMYSIHSNPFGAPDFCHVTFKFLVISHL
jgi:hypothetical protein